MNIVWRFKLVSQILTVEIADGHDKFCVCDLARKVLVLNGLMKNVFRVHRDGVTDLCDSGSHPSDRCGRSRKMGMEMSDISFSHGLGKFDCLKRLDHRGVLGGRQGGPEFREFVAQFMARLPQCSRLD